ncbi:MAG: hypothetical protein IJW39_02925 [Opitutales bacterium]|nr:hypothetical protein [Opitutales bacterium]
MSSPETGFASSSSAASTILFSKREKTAWSWARAASSKNDPSEEAVSSPAFPRGASFCSAGTALRISPALRVLTPARLRASGKYFSSAVAEVAPSATAVTTWRRRLRRRSPAM